MSGFGHECGGAPEAVDGRDDAQGAAIRVGLEESLKGNSNATNQ